MPVYLSEDKWRPYHVDHFYERHVQPVLLYLNEALSLNIDYLCRYVVLFFKHMLWKLERPQRNKLSERVYLSTVTSSHLQDWTNLSLALGSQVLRYVKYSSSSSCEFVLKEAVVALCHILNLGCNIYAFRPDISIFDMVYFFRTRLAVQILIPSVLHSITRAQLSESLGQLCFISTDTQAVVSQG